jgi:hypothetical protein
MSIVILVMEAAGILLIASGITFTLGFMYCKKRILKNLWVYQYYNSQSYVKEVKASLAPTANNKILNDMSDNVNNLDHYSTDFDETVITSKILMGDFRRMKKITRLTPRMTRVINSFAA